MINLLQNFFSIQTHSLLKSYRARSLQNTLRIGISPDDTLAYIDILWPVNLQLSDEDSIFIFDLVNNYRCIFTSFTLYLKTMLANGNISYW